MRCFVVLALLSVALLRARTASAQCPSAFPDPMLILTDRDGFLWDLTSSGVTVEGTNSAFDYGPILSIGDATTLSRYSPSTAPIVSPDGREIQFRGNTVNGIMMFRHVYVPTTASWARFIENIRNTTAVPRDVRVVVETNYGGSPFNVVNTSDGDSTVTPADRSAVVDDADGAGSPALAIINFGPGARLAPTAVSTTVFDCGAGGNQGLRVEYNVTIEPGDTVSFMHFISQQSSRALALSQEVNLDSLPAEALASLQDFEKRRILNWVSLDLGDLCSDPRQCRSGFCVDGFCCDQACGGGRTDDCVACAVAAGVSISGRCARARRGTVCRPAASQCDIADTCTGASDTCAVDTLRPDGTSCDDSQICNGADECRAGSCTHAGLTCVDGNACTSDQCFEPDGCFYSPIVGCPAFDGGTPTENDASIPTLPDASVSTEDVATIIGDAAEIGSDATQPGDDGAINLADGGAENSTDAGRDSASADASAAADASSGDASRDAARPDSSAPSDAALDGARDADQSMIGVNAGVGCGCAVATSRPMSRLSLLAVALLALAFCRLGQRTPTRIG